MVLLLTLPEHNSSPLVLSGARVARSLVLCVCFVDLYLSCGPSPLTIMLSVLLSFTASDYPFGIFKLFLFKIQKCSHLHLRCCYGSCLSCFSCPILPISVVCSFMVASSVFSYAYLKAISKMGDVREFKKIVRMFFFKYLTFFLLQFMRCTNNKVNVNVNIDIVTIP
jgi:hypothetical protein